MRKALIIAPNWIGDAVMAEPLLRSLFQKGLQIDVLATPWVAPIFLACDSVNQVIKADFQHGNLGLGSRKKIAQELQGHAYDEAYVLPNSWKSALIPWLAKIPVRIGYQGELRWGLLNRRLENPPKKNRPSMVIHYAKLAYLGSNPPTTALDLTKPVHPRLQIPKNDHSLAEQKIATLFPTHSSVFVLAPGAEYGPAKQWPLTHFAQLAQQLLRQNPNHVVLICGSPKDIAAGEIITQQVIQNESKFADRIKTLCGQISLSESMALVSLAKGLASNDSGMMHVGAAFEIPQVAFFGSSDPKHTPPLSPYAGILWQGLDCSPCHKRQCPLGHLRCLTEISPDTAYLALEQQITLKG